MKTWLMVTFSIRITVLTLYSWIHTSHVLEFGKEEVCEAEK